MRKFHLSLFAAASIGAAILFATMKGGQRSHLQACTDCTLGCQPGHYAPIPSSWVEWLIDPIDPGNQAPNAGDCDPNSNPEGSAPCEQENPCKATGLLVFRNISAGDIQYKLVVNGNTGASSWVLVGAYQTVRINWSSGFKLPCGYLDTTGDGDPVPKDSLFEILIQHDSGGQWFIDPAMYRFSCTLCDRDKNLY